MGGKWENDGMNGGWRWGFREEKNDVLFDFYTVINID